MIENKCDKCRNTFQDCSSDPVFVTEDEASAEGIPADTIKECDCFEPEENMSVETEEKDNPCTTCYEDREFCGHNPDVNGHCDYYDNDDDDDDDDDDFYDEEEVEESEENDNILYDDDNLPR